VDMDLLQSGFPQWEFEAQWIPPERRGLFEPVLQPPNDYCGLLLDLLARPNICSTEWITRQYDHEVQGSSVIKPLVGAERDVNSDAAVIRPVLSSQRGLAFAQALLPTYSAIDAYHMTSCTIDEAVRRLIAVGAGLDDIGGVDNFCWPSIQYDPRNNPDGKFKAAQLVRSCWALRDICEAYEIPLLSGKDSMYVDGNLPGPYGESHKISALETLQFSTIAVVEDTTKCVTMDNKVPGDWIYILGITRDELGGSEYYDHLGYIGVNLPQVRTDEFIPMYKALALGIQSELVASVHGLYRGGLGIHLAMTAMAANLGLSVDLSGVPLEGILNAAGILFSESAGRFLVTVDPANRQAFEALFADHVCACIGTVTDTDDFRIKDLDGVEIINLSIRELKMAWKKLFGDLI